MDEFICPKCRSYWDGEVCDCGNIYEEYLKPPRKKVRKEEVQPRVKTPRREPKEGEQSG